MCHVAFQWGLLAEGMERVDLSALAEVAIHQRCVPQDRWPEQQWCLQAVEPSKAKVGSIQPRALVALVVTQFHGHRRDRLRGKGTFLGQPHCSDLPCYISLEREVTWKTI